MQQITHPATAMSADTLCLNTLCLFRLRRSCHAPSATRVAAAAVLGLALSGAADAGRAQEVTAAPAQRLWLNAGALSYHFDRSKNLRDDNWGLGAEYWLDRRNALMAGSFINSNDARTRYAAWVWRPVATHWGPVAVGAGVGLAAFDGYPNYRNGSWFVTPMPVLTFEYQRVGLNLYPTPKVNNSLNAAISFQFKLALW